MDLVIKYDPKADILAVKLREGEVRDEKLLDNDVVLGLDNEGELVALEVWDASKRGLLKSLADLVKESSCSFKEFKLLKIDLTIWRDKDT